jgi:hypothetical protein
MQPKQLRLIAKHDDKQFRVIRVGNGDRHIESKRFDELRNRVAMPNNQRAAV